MSETDFKLVSSKINEEKVYLNHVSQEIWKNPELKFEEIFAHNILTEALTKYGFEVQKNYLMPTAFRAEFSRGKGPTIAVLLEYDALPKIGHACGHNLIAEAGLAAGIGIKAAMTADPNIQGKLVLLGTPAEEAGGGKIKLIQFGAFNDVDVAMMVHPAKMTTHNSRMLSRVVLSVEFEGKESHASAFPWEGVNALDAAVLLYQSLGLMRQQMKLSCRIHAIITNGGTATNIIPGKSGLDITLRAPSKSELRILKPKVENCVQGAATATGCTYSIHVDEEGLYDDLLTNPVLCELYSGFCEKQGLQETDMSSLKDMPLGSSDMGNVSYTVPSIHPFYSINTDAVNHSKGFTTAAGSVDAQLNTLIVGKAMAMTALALMRDPRKLAQAKDHFKIQTA